MPRINKVRLIHFAWGKRRIDDLTLDFHGGQNAELRLDNGGGKSVLERLIYQAVWPNSTISRNPVSDYLTDKPATVVIEWLLDTAKKEAADILTSGVVLVRQGSSDDMKAFVNYFCFDSHDEKHLNLHSLPHVHTVSGGRAITIDNFQDSRNAFIALSQRYSEIHYYSRRDDSDYRKMLGSFGISAENWSQLIRQLISGEDSFADLLEKTKTSDTLLDKYMIPMISSHLDQISDSRNIIRENTDNVVEESAQQQHSILLRDAIRDYIADSDDPMKQMMEIREKVSSRDENLEQIAAFRMSVEKFLSACAEKKQEIENRQDELVKKRQRIEEERASGEYYENADAYEKARDAEKEISDRHEASKEKLNEIQRQWNVAEASEIYRDQQMLQHQIEGLRLKMDEGKKSEQANAARILRYSLKKAYEKELSDLDTLIEQLQKSQENNRKKLHEIEADLGALKAEQDTAQHSQIELEVKIQAMDEKEEELFDRLKLGFRCGRTFTGELVKADVTDAQKILDERVHAIEKEESAKQNEKKQKEDAIPQCIRQLQSHRREEEDCRQHLKDLSSLLQDFLDRKDRLSVLFAKYDIPESCLFKKERESTLEKMHADYEERLQKCQYDLGVMQNLVSSIRNGSAYLPLQLIELLQREKIHFQTGQEFLKSRNDDEKLMRDHPLLPYGILLDLQDYQRLQKIEKADFFLDRIIPVFLYEDLNKREEIQYSGMVLSDASQKYLSQVEPGLLSDEGESAFLQKKTLQMQELERLAASYREAVSDLSEALRLCEKFPYQSDEEETLKQKKQEAQSQIEMHMQQAEDLEKQQAELQKEIPSLINEISEIRSRLKEAEKEREEFLSFVKNDVSRVKMAEKLDEVNQSLYQIEKRTNDLKDQQERESGNRNTLRDKLHDICADRDEENKEAGAFMDAEETGQIKDGSVAALREEYRVISDSLSRDEAENQRMLEQAQKNFREKEERLGRLGVDESVYQVHRYDPKEKDSLRAMEDEEKKTEERLNQMERQAWGRTSVMHDRFVRAENSLKELGLEKPLEKEEITGDFDLRLGRIKDEEITLKKQENILEKQINGAEGAQSRIVDADIPAVTAAGTAVLAQDLSAQVKELIKAYRISGKDVQSALDAFSGDLKRRSRVYTQRDPFFEKVFDIDLSSARADQFTLKDADNLIASWNLKTETLKKKLDQLNADLQSFDQDQKQLYRQILSRTKALSQALSSVTSRSRVRVEGRQTPQRLLVIDQPQIDEYADERINGYLKQSFSELARIASEKKEDYEKQRDILLNERRLLNVYLNTEKIKIKVYKFEKVASSSQLMEWDRACRSNSGGEHSLSCFIVIASMMAYIRNDQSEFEGESSIRHYETIICDNPFASVSSEHLVKPLIQIVNTLNIQLITFTHITSASIANSFDVVIQLRNVTNSGDVARLSVENEYVSEEAMNMESASLYRQSVQESLF